MQLLKDASFLRTIAGRVFQNRNPDFRLKSTVLARVLYSTVYGTVLLKTNYCRIWIDSDVSDPSPEEAVPCGKQTTKMYEKATPRCMVLVHTRPTMITTLI
jgi:hypothetical protein